MSGHLQLTMSLAELVEVSMLENWRQNVIHHFTLHSQIVTHIDSVVDA
jgi:hypothetical protein